MLIVCLRAVSEGPIYTSNELKYTRYDNLDQGTAKQFEVIHENAQWPATLPSENLYKQTITSSSETTFPYFPENLDRTGFSQMSSKHSFRLSLPIINYKHPTRLVADCEDANSIESQEMLKHTSYRDTFPFKNGDVSFIFDHDKPNRQHPLINKFGVNKQNSYKHGTYDFDSSQYSSFRLDCLQPDQQQLCSSCTFAENVSSSFPYVYRDLTLEWPCSKNKHVYVKTSADDWLQLHKLTKLYVY